MSKGSIEVMSYLIFVLGIILAIVSSILKSSWFKGKLGEYKVNQLLKTLDDNYTVAFNATLPSNNGTTQVDHIVFSPFGIFVIETKNMKGWIFGGQYQKTWTQKIFKKSYKFQNPLHQNYKHTKTIAEILGEPHENFHSIVVFFSQATFKTDMPKNVIHPIDLIRYIESFDPILYTEAQLDGFIDKLLNTAEKDGVITDLKHVKSLKERYGKAS